MNWIKEKLEAAVEWLYTFDSKWFVIAFPIVTLIVTALIVNPFYYLTDICIKTSLCPEKDIGEILLNCFLMLWIACMVFCASLLFGLGSRILKYVVTKHRVDDLKTSGLVEKTKNKIDLIGLSLMPFAAQGWPSILEGKLKSGVKIRLLIIDPETEFAKNRHSSLHGDDKTLSDDIHEAISIFKSFKKSLSNKYGNDSNNFEVRVYKSNPSMSTFILDDEIRLGLMIEKGTGLTAPEIRISNSGKQVELYRQITDHFDNVWDNAIEFN